MVSRFVDQAGESAVSTPFHVPVQMITFCPSIPPPEESCGYRNPPRQGVVSLPNLRYGAR